MTYLRVGLIKQRQRDARKRKVRSLPNKVKSPLPSEDNRPQRAKSIYSIGLRVVLRR